MGDAAFSARYGCRLTFFFGDAAANIHVLLHHKKAGNGLSLAFDPRLFFTPALQARPSLLLNPFDHVPLFIGNRERLLIAPDARCAVQP